MGGRLQLDRRQGPWGQPPWPSCMQLTTLPSLHLTQPLHPLPPHLSDGILVICVRDGACDSAGVGVKVAARPGLRKRPRLGAARGGQGSKAAGRTGGTVWLVEAAAGDLWGMLGQTLSYWTTARQLDASGCAQMPAAWDSGTVCCASRSRGHLTHRVLY